jgi:hypothetical protein
VFGVLVAATIGIGLGSLTGAERSESAFDRLRTVTRSSDIRLGVADATLAASMDALARVEGIAEVGVGAEMFVRPAGTDLIPGFQLLSSVTRPDLGGTHLDIPRITAGRAIRADAVDEVVLSETLADELDVDVGDSFALESMSEEYVDIAYAGGDPGPPDGPVIDVEVVGLARTPADFGRFAGRVLHLSPAFAARFEDRIRIHAWVSARVDDPTEQGLNALAEGPLSRLEGEIDLSYFADSQATNDGLGTIAVSLRLVALAAVLAGATAIGLALARLARDILDVRGSLSAIGWTRVQLVQLVALVLGPWMLGGIVVGLVLGAVGSRSAVVRLARAVDPAVDAIILYPRWIAVVGLMALLVLGLLLAVVAVRAARLVPGGTALGRAVPPLTHPLAVPIAVRRALFGASDRGGRASRGAVVAIAASVTVAVAALVVSASIQRLQDDPSLSGQGRIDRRVIDSAEATVVYDRAMALLKDDPRAVDLVGLHVGFGVTAPGSRELTVLVLDVRRGDPGAAITSGRLAAQPDEVAVGPATLDELDLAVGDDVELESEHGSARFRIVGTTLFPEGDFNHDSGLAITVGGADRFMGGVAGTAIHQVAFSWAEGVDDAAAERSLVEQGLRPFTTGEALEPAAVSNLDEVRDLPRLLAALVIALGLATLLHALMVTARQREAEAGTLRALGVAPRAIGALIGIQAFAVALLAVLIGIPLGLGLGRQVWSPIAERAHVVEVAVAPWDGVAWVVLAVLGGAALLAVPVAIGAGRQRPAGTLRAE